MQDLGLIEGQGQSRRIPPGALIVGDHAEPQGDLLHRVYALSRRLRAAAERDVLRSHGLDIRDWLMLRSLARFGAATQRQLAVATELDKVAASRSAARLKALGLVDSFPNKRDGRSHLLALTKAGEDLLDTCNREVSALESGLVADLTAGERWELAKLLRHLQYSAARSA